MLHCTSCIYTVYIHVLEISLWVVDEKRADQETDGLRNLIAYESLVQAGFSSYQCLEVHYC